MEGGLGDVLFNLPPFFLTFFASLFKRLEQASLPVGLLLNPVKELVFLAMLYGSCQTQPCQGTGLRGDDQKTDCGPLQVRAWACC